MSTTPLPPVDILYMSLSGSHIPTKFFFFYFFYRGILEIKICYEGAEKQYSAGGRTGPTELTH